MRCARESLSVSAESNQRPLRRTLADAMRPHPAAAVLLPPVLLSKTGPARTRTSMCSNMRALLPLLLPVLGELYGAKSENAKGSQAEPTGLRCNGFLQGRNAAMHRSDAAMHRSSGTLIGSNVAMLRCKGALIGSNAVVLRSKGTLIGSKAGMLRCKGTLIGSNAAMLRCKRTLLGSNAAMLRCNGALHGCNAATIADKASEDGYRCA